jgi:hypothetical protein
MTIEERATRAGTALRAAVDREVDLMTVSELIPIQATEQHRRRNRLLAAAAAVALLVGAAIALPQLSADPAPPADDGLPRISTLGVSVAIPAGWQDSGEVTPADGLLLDDIPPAQAPKGYLDVTIAAYGLQQVWEPVRAEWVAPPTQGFASWLRTNPAFVIDEETPVTVAGQDTVTLQFHYNADAYGGGRMPLLATTFPLSDEPAKTWPDLAGDPLVLNTGETGYLTPIVVDGQTVLFETWLWPPTVLTAYRMPNDQQLADYQTVLASARIE